MLSEFKDWKVVCIKDKAPLGMKPNITKGKIYEIVYADSEYIHVLNDIGEWDFFPFSYFVDLNKIRLKNIKKILDSCEL